MNFLFLPRKLFSTCVFVRERDGGEKEREGVEKERDRERNIIMEEYLMRDKGPTFKKKILEHA